MDLEYQRKLVEELYVRGENNYRDAAIYTVLLDLIEGSSLSEVLFVLGSVVSDLENEGRLEERRKLLQGFKEDYNTRNWEDSHIADRDIELFLAK